MVSWFPYFRQAKGRTSTKLTTMVEFPLTDLDMTPHLARRNENTTESPRRRLHRAPTNSPSIQHDNVYDLYAVCYHHGDDLETGHYTAACKNPYDGRWYKFDDSRVTPVDDESAAAELINNTAYMLFYKRKKPRVFHIQSTDMHDGHWALKMPKYTKRSETTELTEVKEEITDDTRNELDLESETTAPVLSREPSIKSSSSSIQDDTNIPQHVVTVIHNTIQSPALRRPLIIEVNGNNDSENETAEPYIHKDVHVNPKMTPVDSRRPKSVDYPAKSGSSRDVNRNYESSPLVASINGVEYHPTTEDLVLSMFQESKYMVPRHPNHISGDAHNRTGNFMRFGYFYSSISDWIIEN